MVCALYGLKIAGSDFRNHLAHCMQTMGYESCLSDQDLWYKPMVHPEDGFENYAYMLLYVDDALSVGYDPMGELTKLY